MLFPTVGGGLLIIGTGTGALRHQTPTGADPAGHLPSSFPQDRPEACWQAAVHEHCIYFGIKQAASTCKYIQATWHDCVHFLRKYEQTKMCRDGHRPGFGSSRAFRPAVNAAPWRRSPALAGLDQQSSLATGIQLTYSHL